MNTQLVVRSPIVSDKLAWRRLWRAYVGFYEAEVSSEATDLTWRRMLTNEGPLFGRIATLDAVPVGFAIYIVHDGTWTTQPTCYLEDLFVDASVRSNGAGRALLDDMVTLARESSWSSLYWHTRRDNARARRLYDHYTLADEFVRYRMTV